MKQFLTASQGKKFLFSFFIATLIIWFLGPYIAIAGKIPLGSLNNRMVASVIVFIFFFAMEYNRSSKNIIHNDLLPNDIKNELQNLQHNLQSVLKALHRGVIGSFLHRYKKPWFLVLGPVNSGKSTLLNKAELNIKGLDNLPPMTITPTKFFNWWLADDAVFIDVGGRYLRDAKESRMNIEQLFQGFFKLLKKYRAYKPLNGLILTINLQELTVNTKEQSQLQKLKQIIDELVLQLINFPIYIIITRCDMVEGFVEFFEDLGPEERNQIFGISFPLATPAESLPQLFNEEYNGLLNRLNERIIWRLQQENNLDKIGKIKNFPLQMEYLKNPLAKLLNLILPNTNLNLRGVFFTSSLQKDAPYDNLSKTLSRAYDIHHIHNAHRTTPAKCFFISEIFKRIVLPETKFYLGNNQDHRLHFFSSLLIILVTSICLFFFYHSYQYNQQTIQNTQLTIDKIDHTNHSEDTLFYKLNLLQNIITHLNQRKGPWYSKIGVQLTQKINNQAKEIYTSLLTTQFLNYLQRILEIQLQNTPEDNSSQLYAALKTYLMLGEHKHFDKKFFSAWFDNYWHQLNYDNTTHQNLNKHLSALFEHTVKEVKLNEPLIESKRAVLNSMSQSKLVLTILENQYQRSPVKITPDLPGSIFSSIPTEIPGIFNILNFSHVYYSAITRTCQEITNGNWVLGKKPQPAFSDIMLHQLSSEVKAIYLNEYAKTWAEVLSKIKIDEFQNLAQITAMLDLLNNPESPLVKLINTIQNNTQPLSDSVEFTQQISSRFLTLQSLSTEVLKNTHQVSLSALKEYLEKIIHGNDIDKSSYDAAKVRMENQGGNDAITTILQQARLLPEPLQTWHRTIAAESWRLILKQTQNYLNKIWVANVYPQYIAILDKRYPLFKESTVDVSLNDFAAFFGNGGTMDIFFKNYLQPFVDSSRLYWEWKIVDGQKITISQTTLEMFIRAALIQKMFFPEDSKVPSIAFSLVPVDLDPGVQTFNLTLEGQSVLFQKDNEQIISLTWPGPQPGNSEISFIDHQGKKSMLSETGCWSWFKLLDKSLLESTASPKHFKLTFNLNNSAVHYELYTNGIVNPFIPGIVNAFRCPENL